MNYLMKTQAYNPLITGHSKYEAIRKLLLQKSDPPIQIEVISSKTVLKSLFSVRKVVLADSLRVQGTYKHLVDSLVIPKNIISEQDKLLNEIRFDIKDFISEKDYECHGSDGVRQAFIDGFINNGLSESRSDIRKRCDELSARLRSATGVLYISHTFFLKVFLAYSAEAELFERPELIKKHIKKEKRIMDFGEVFGISNIAI